MLRGSDDASRIAALKQAFLKNAAARREERASEPGAALDIWFMAEPALSRKRKASPKADRKTSPADARPQGRS